MMEDTRTIGERDREHQAELQLAHLLGERPRLVVDNTCPVTPIRRRQGAIQGIRTIYGDGGPDNAA